jgi:serine/threonine protein kinase/tetratricopeptide (TPR) repeat protein
MRDLIGRTLGHYRIVEKIGAGGMGVVYLARDERLDRDVAIKVLPEEVAADADRLEDGVAYAVMELLEGEALRELISKDGITTGKAVEYARAIADGLAAAHDKGIVHRDLKPENVFLTTDGRIKILDFGLAKLKLPEADLTTETPTATLDTAAGGLIGTVPYMAPEQVQGQPTDQRSDIFALGVVLYEMLTGDRPFGGSTTVETAAAILKEDPEPISVAAPAVSPALGSVVSKCLEKRPEDRFSSAHDLALTLGAVDSVVWSPPTKDRSLIRKSWPHMLAVVIAAVIALFFIFPPEGPFERLAEQPAEVSVPRIVVLPFENLGSPDAEYFADGITEEITSRLAAVSGLQVISRTSAMHYKDRRVPVQQIGEELDVGFVLEGTIRWDRGESGHGRVRITPQLIKVADDSHLWSDRYDRELEDIFSVQSDIAEQVIVRLQATLLDPEQRAIEARPTENMEAYQAYLLGIQYKRVSEMAEDLLIAAEMFQRAVALDPDFALAYVELVETHSRIISLRQDLSSDHNSKALDALEKLMVLQPNLSETHRTNGYYRYWVDRDYEGALEEFALAAEGKPGDGRAYEGMAFVMRRQGRMRESISMLGKAIHLDPLGAMNYWDQAWTYTAIRDYENAVDNFTRALSMSPDFVEGYFPLALAYRLWDGHPDRARRALESMPVGTHPVADYTWLIQELYERNYQLALDRLLSSPETVFTLPRHILPAALVECECLLEMDRAIEAEPACKRAMHLLEEWVREYPEDPRGYSALGKAYALVGRREDAIRHGKEAVAMLPVSRDAAEGIYFENYLAEIYALVDEPELGIAKLEYLLSIPSLVSAEDLRFNPSWDSLRDHPRFQALLEEYDTV